MKERFASKNQELRDRLAKLCLQRNSFHETRNYQLQLTTKLFELSPYLEEQWLTADVRANRQLLDIVCLNLSLDGVTLVPKKESPSTCSPKSFLSRQVGVTSARLNRWWMPSSRWRWRETSNPFKRSDSRDYPLDSQLLDAAGITDRFGGGARALSAAIDVSLATRSS